MTMTIYEILTKVAGFSYRQRHDGQYGVEIETESIDSYRIPDMKFWNSDRDNSLRNFGIEYILKAPMVYKEIPLALNEFKTFAGKVSFIPDSHSTSVHVHINFLNETFLTMANFFTTWSLIENLMIKFSGPDRLSNLFCLPIKDAEGVLDTLKNILQKVQTKDYKRISINNDAVKYGAINPGPFLNLGSIEVRCFRGEMNTDLQFQWISLLESIIQYCRTKDLTPKVICDTYKDQGFRILDTIFGSLAPVIKQRMAPSELTDYLNTNIKYAARLASVSTRWEKFGIVVQKKVYKQHLKADLDALASKFNSSDFNTLSYHLQMVVQEMYETSNPTVRITETEEDI